MAKCEPPYVDMLSDFERGERAALLMVRSFIAKNGKADVDAFCMQALADQRADTEHRMRKAQANG